MMPDKIARTEKGQVDRQMEDLEENLEAIRKTADTLIARLAPVLYTNELEDEKLQEAPKELLCNLATGIRNMADLAKSIEISLVRTIRTLQI